MVKVIKKHPASKRGGVVKIFTIDYLDITAISLTAMPERAKIRLNSALQQYKRYIYRLS